MDIIYCWVHSMDVDEFTTSTLSNKFYSVSAFLISNCQTEVSEAEPKEVLLSVEFVEKKDGGKTVTFSLSHPLAGSDQRNNSGPLFWGPKELNKSVDLRTFHLSEVKSLFITNEWSLGLTFRSKEDKKSLIGTIGVATHSPSPSPLSVPTAGEKGRGDTPSSSTSDHSSSSQKKKRKQNDGGVNGEGREGENGRGEKEVISEFDRKTDETSSSQYFYYYGCVIHQQNMLQDSVRTSTYQRAFLENPNDFEQKVVLDVGCGSGILSFFALQAGASKVYGIEASRMANHARLLSEQNRLSTSRSPSTSSSRFQVIFGKVEEVEVPEKVDVIISEPMGTLLLNERMIESYIYARKKWLKESGKMFPSKGAIFVAPFSDHALFFETTSKAAFWAQQSFYGVDLSALHNEAKNEYFSQPVVDYIDPSVLVGTPVVHQIDFMTCDEKDLERVEIELEFHILTPGMLHGVACWFDVLFEGSRSKVCLSTAPGGPPTHWYQIRCLLRSPLAVTAGQIVKGKLLMQANSKQSYDCTLELGDPEDPFLGISRNHINLKDPNYHFSSSYQSSSFVSPSLSVPPVWAADNLAATNLNLIASSSAAVAASSSSITGDFGLLNYETADILG